MTRVLWLVCAAICLLGCSRPAGRTLEICRARAQVEAQGKGLGSEDVAELVEACMLDRGWALKEGGPRCTDSAPTASDSHCYYQNNSWGRLYSKIMSD